jgi:peptidoglycan/LPS O-acetylase OafA/YrhL
LAVSIIGVAMTIALAEKLSKVRALGFVNTLGAHSFQIYLLHLFVVAIVLAIVAPIADLPALQQISNLLPWALAAFALYTSLLLFKLLRRFSWLWVSPFKKRTARTRRPSTVGPQE